MSLHQKRMCHVFSAEARSRAWAGRPAAYHTLPTSGAERIHLTVLCTSFTPLFALARIPICRLKTGLGSVSKWQTILICEDALTGLERMSEVMVLANSFSRETELIIYELQCEGQFMFL